VSEICALTSLIEKFDFSLVTRMIGGGTRIWLQACLVQQQNSCFVNTRYPCNSGSGLEVVKIKPLW
jgi:hypothetical protein